MKTKQKVSRHQKKFRLSVALLLLGFLLGTLLPSLKRKVQAAPHQAAALDVVINEVAWMGTDASSDDEWIELYSPGVSNFDLTDWRLVADDGSPDIILSGITSADGYFLLERTHLNVVKNVPGFDGATPDNLFDSNQVYSGKLDDDGEILRLRAPNGEIIDTANGNDGAWPNGSLSPASSMERMEDTTDTDDIWVTNPNAHSTTIDANDNPIYGTPGEANWGYGVSHTPVPPTIAATFTPTPVESLNVLINEIAWAGTQANADAEWIELYNPTSVGIDLDGWRLISGNGGSDDLVIMLDGHFIGPEEYFLLEQGVGDDAISNLPADMHYDGLLSDSGEQLRLIDSGSNTVDKANSDGGSWPAGKASDFRSMERSGVVEDSSSAWFTFAGTTYNGLDTDGEDILGTPGEANWAISVTATPTPIPTSTPISPTRTPTPYPFQSVVLNEVLARPGHDWNRDGVVDVHDEFVEIINRGTTAFNLQNWKLDDEYNSGSPPYTLPNIALQPGQRIAIYGYTSHISLSDGGDTVRLLNSSSQIVDVVTYTVAKAADESWCRFPEDGYWNTDCFPTPDEENRLNGDLENAPQISGPYTCSVPDTVPETIWLIECGPLGMNINDGYFWDRDISTIWIRGNAKYGTWFR